MKAIFGVVVVVVKIQPRCAKVHFVGFVGFPNFRCNDAVNAGTQRAFMHGELFVKLEVACMGVVVEVVFKEIEPLKYVGLLDVDTAQNSVPGSISG